MGARDIRGRVRGSTAVRRPWGRGGASALMLIAACLPASIAAQQAPVVRVMESDRVLARDAALALVEPRPAAHPSDPGRMVVGTIAVSPESDGAWHCAVYSTVDGGAQWVGQALPTGRCIDPWPLVHPDGSASLWVIELRDDAEGPDIFRAVRFDAPAVGAAWREIPDTSLSRRHDHLLAVPGREPNSLVLASRHMHLDEAGFERHRVWVGTGKLDSPLSDTFLTPSQLGLNATGIAVLPTGRIVVGFWDFQRNVEGFGREGMLWSARGWVVVSDDGGRTFSAPDVAADACASGLEGAFPGYPFLSGDATPASAYAGNVYHACVRPGLDGISFSRSSNEGETWSDPMRLAPPSSTVSVSNARTPMLAVAPDGSIGVAWYERGADPEGACQQVWFAGSSDGGASFSEAVRVSTEASCPDRPENGRAGRSWSAGGDYSSMVADADGRFQLVWADSRDGRFHLRRALIACCNAP